MKVKIVKARLKTFWYADRIGEVFDAENASSIDWKLVEDPSSYVEKEDCEIIPSQFRIMRQKAPGKKYKTRGTILHGIDEAKNLLRQLRENFPQYKYILVEVVEGDMDV